ncbi:bifunctional metallophosphatase/5'-nucleotidase [Amycolatopsis alkalitolerans]|uniref:Twin-arginine translocation signal domain-containing protein n=1 Tax=Amycolatopsis alkalitolerans TaxID=2547244 RepID=A0A5C4M8B0_9PSEU|nr:bifunctional metallophosphatase/5'-nucleotidase [Amycolatopsis alkalitolerans]TNC29728.1 twin-arginine translocation signal domain-containing protein [Amycolatopsis alkalitolerans]
MREEHTEPSRSGDAFRTTRRDLLKAVGVAGLAVTFGPTVAAEAGEGTAARQSIRRSRAVAGGKASHLTLLQTADIHGQIETHDEFFWENGRPAYRRVGGFPRIKTLVDGVRADNPGGTVLLDCGDCFQGSGYAALSRGEVMAPIMREMGYNLVIPGNWEVVYGKDQLLKVINDYGAPVVCTNMFHDENGRAGGPLFLPHHVVDIAGVRIGVVGFNDPMVPVRQDPAYSAGIKFTQPEYNAAEQIRMLREDEHCELVLAMTHMGIAQQVGLASEPYMAGVDYVLGADTHERIRDPLQGKYCRVTEPGAFGSFVGRLDVVVENGKVREQGYELIEVAERRYVENPKMRHAVSEATGPYKARLEKVIGRTKTPILRYYILETPMDNLITDALYEKARPDVALSNGFRFGPPLVPGRGGIAQITENYLWSMLPVNSQAEVADVSGALLKPWMEKELNNVFAADPAQRFGGWVVRMRGMEVNFTAGKPFGSRVNWIKIAGAPLDPNRVYRVLACDRGGDPPDVLCRIKGVGNKTALGFTIHDAVTEYLAKNSPVAPRLEGRVTATDLPQTALGQLPGTGYEFH